MLRLGEGECAQPCTDTPHAPSRPAPPCPSAATRPLRGRPGTSARAAHRGWAAAARTSRGGTPICVPSYIIIICGVRAYLCTHTLSRCQATERNVIQIMNQMFVFTKFGSRPYQPCRNVFANLGGGNDGKKGTLGRCIPLGRSGRGSPLSLSLSLALSLSLSIDIYIYKTL